MERSEWVKRGKEKKTGKSHAIGKAFGFVPEPRAIFTQQLVTRAKQNVVHKTKPHTHKQFLLVSLSPLLFLRSSASSLSFSLTLCLLCILNLCYDISYAGHRYFGFRRKFITITPQFFPHALTMALISLSLSLREWVYRNNKKCIKHGVRYVCLYTDAFTTCMGRRKRLTEALISQESCRCLVSSRGFFRSFYALIRRSSYEKSQ